jgi:hypothetical protein
MRAFGEAWPDPAICQWRWQIPVVTEIWSVDRRYQGGFVGAKHCRRL